MNADARFARCLADVLHHEGGFSNDPQDSGGPTNRGITLDTLSAYLGRTASVTELKLMPAELVAAVYRRDFWGAVRGDMLFAGVDLISFDGAVNCGPGRAVRWLQHALGVTADGVIGAGTLRALSDAHDGMVIEDIRQAREAYYRSLPTFGRFGDGWLRRLDEVAAQAVRGVACRSPLTARPVVAAINMGPELGTLYAQATGAAA